jgi:hypothetical protein
LPDPVRFFDVFDGFEYFDFNHADSSADLVKEYASYKPYNGQITPEAVIDDERGHYEVVHVGWDGARRVHGSIVHLDIIGEKMWIQFDGTSRSVAD